MSNKNHAKSDTLLGKLTPQEVRHAIREMCDKHGYDPFEKLVTMAVEGYTVLLDDGTLVKMPLDADQQITIAREIAPYLAPKLKSLEISGEIDNKLEISIKMVGGADKIIQLPSNNQANGSDTQRILKDRILEPAKKMTDALGDLVSKEVENGD